VGSSAWDARVPYQDEIGAALKQARQNAYDQGDFYRVSSADMARSMSEEDYLAWGVAQLKAVFPDDDTWQPTGQEHRDEWRAAQVVVSGPDSLLESQPFSGTHSVIDMTHVADEPDYSAAAPPPAEYLRELFGTTEPSVAEIEAAINEHRLHGFGRGHGMYLIGYEEGKPKEIFFVGHSGD